MERHIAMLITKFNKLIHNKIIWAAFAILVSLSMVGLFAPTSGGGGQPDNAVGTLFGEPVSHEELARIRRCMLAFQPPRGNGEEQQKMIQDEAWRRLAVRRYATRLGVRVSNQEIGEAIARDPSFAVNGVFNRQRYQQLVEQQIGVPMGLFEDYLRDELLLQKMQALVGTSIWIAPHELQENVSRYTDRFTVNVIELSATNLVNDVTASDAQVRDFYDRNPPLFNTPELRSVYYVEWPVQEIAKTVNVSETQIQDAYDRDIESYSVTDTNTMAVSYTPLEEVADELRAKIANREALGIAGEYAMQFRDDLRMRKAADPVSIHSLAEARGMNVHTSELFSAIAPVTGTSAGTAFNKAAFKLDPQDPANTYSSAVIGDDAVYLLAWHTNRPAVLQPFEDVKDTATGLATEQARQEAFTTRVAEIRRKFEDARKEKTDFATAASALKLEVVTVGPFSVYDADPEKIPFFSDIAPAVLPLATGELAEPVKTAENTLIVYLAAREPGNPSEADSLKPEITRMLQSSRMRMHFAAWSEELMAKAKDNKGKEEPAAN